MRTDLRLDGRRRHSRDLWRSTLAMDSVWCQALRRGRIISTELDNEVRTNIMKELCDSMGAEAFSFSKFKRAAELLR